MTKLSVNREQRCRAKTETFETTISGLLTKRSDLLAELADIEARIPEIHHDVNAMDRVLAALGYRGNVAVIPVRKPRDAPFKRGQVMRAICDALRASETPLTTRQIAEACLPNLVDEREEDVPLVNLCRRVSQSLQRLRKEGAVTRRLDDVGNAVWALIA